MNHKLRTFFLGIALLISGCTEPHSPEDTIQVFYESLARQNTPELISLFDLDQNLKARESEAELYELLATIFEDLALNIHAKGGIYKIEYHSIEYILKEHAIVRYTLYFNDGSSSIDTLSLHKDLTDFWRLTLE